MDAGGTSVRKGVRGRVVGWGCVRGRPALLRRSARGGSGPAVHPGVAHDVARVLKPADVTELGEDRDGGQIPDAIERLYERASAGLAARDRV